MNIKKAIEEGILSKTEIDKELINIAHNNLANLKSSKAPVELINCDAAAFEFQDENIIFLYNPFGFKTIESIIDNIKKSLVKNPRLIRIVSCAVMDRGLLKRQDWLILEKELLMGSLRFWRNKC